MAIADQQFQSVFLEINGARLHVKKAGSGPACLLLHGYPETWYTWRKTIPVLAEHFTVYAPDFRGWGESSGPGPLSLRTMVEDTLAIMRALGHTKYIVVGHDWGAAAAYAIAKTEPSLVEKFVTINMPLKRADFTKPLHFYFFNSLLLPELVMWLFSDWLVRFIIRWWAHNQAAFPEEVIRYYQDVARRPGANAATLAYYRNSFRAILLRKKESYGLGGAPVRPSVPWHVLWGGDDPVSPMKNVRYFQEDMPGVPITLIPGAGHFPQEEQPELFNQGLLEFLLA